MTTYISDAPYAPAPIGPYSQAAVAGNWAFLSGQLGIDPDSGKLVDGGVESQTQQVMQNLKAVLEHLKLNFSHVAKTTIYLTDLNNFKTVNLVYEKWLQDSKPARATVQVAALPLGGLVEIDMVAHIATP